MTVVGLRRGGVRSAELRVSCVDIVVECNAGPAAEYERGNVRRPRLVAIHPAGGEDLPGDIGRVADSLDSCGSALRAIVVSEASAHPGAVVPAYVVGLVRASGPDGDWLIVTPANGGGAVALDDLPSEFHQRLQAFLGSDALEWVARDDAELLAHEAIERGRRAQAQERAERAWADVLWAPTPATQRRWAVFEGETHTQAEMDVLRIPYRFQLYLREVLLPRERLLASVHRKPLALGRWPFRRQTTHEAIVLLTDQQLLVLADARAPDATVPIGGFVARSTAVERIAGVELQQHDHYVELRVEIASAAGPAFWSILALNHAGFEELGSQLARFTPRAGQRLLARRGHVEPLDLDTTGWHAFFEPEEQAAWGERVRATVEPQEALVAWALSPSGMREAGPTAVVLTTQRVIAVSGVSSVRSWTGREITSVELADSPFASELRLWTVGTTPTFRLSSRSRSARLS